MEQENVASCLARNSEYPIIPPELQGVVLKDLVEKCIAFLVLFS